MSNNSYPPQSHSPLLPAEEGEEWVPVVQWVRKTAVPSTQAGTHESQIVMSSLLSQFSMPTDTPQSFYPSQIWNQSQLVGMNNYSSPTSTSSLLNNASSPLNNTSFSGSPVDQLFDDFDIDAAIQDSNLFNADQSLLGLTDQSLFGFADHSLLGLSDEHLLSAPTSDPSLFDADLFDTFVDFSGAELGFSPTPASTRSFASSTTAAVSPTSFTEGLEGFSVLTPYSSAPSVATPEFTSYSSLRTGAQAAGATPDSTTSSPPVSPSSQALFPCTYGHCNHVFDNANNLRRHERKHRSNFKCEICGKPHIDKRGLSRHMWAQHPDEAKQRNTRSEVIKCNECDYTGRSDNVARHARHRHKR